MGVQPKFSRMYLSPGIVGRVNFLVAAELGIRSNDVHPFPWNAEGFSMIVVVGFCRGSCCNYSRVVISDSQGYELFLVV